MYTCFKLSACNFYIHSRKELSQYLALNNLIVAITPFFSPYLVSRLKPKALITLPQSVRSLNFDLKVFFVHYLHAKIYFTKNYLFLTSANLTKYPYLEFTIKVERNPQLDTSIIKALPLRKEEYYEEILSILREHTA